MQLSSSEASQLLKVSERTLGRWVVEGGLPASRINDQLWFNKDELLEWATARKLKVAPGAFQQSENTVASKTSFADALELGGIYYQVEGNNREKVMRAIVQTLKLSSESDRDVALQLLLAREQLGTTALGDGIAIPHVRSPLVVQSGKPIIGLYFLSETIDLEAPDGKPVHTLFFMASTTVRDHLELLSRLAAALGDTKFKEAVMQRQNPADILREARRLEMQK